MHARAVVTSVCVWGGRGPYYKLRARVMSRYVSASRPVASRHVRQSVSHLRNMYKQSSVFYFLSDTADPRVSVFFLFLHKISPPDLGALTAGGPVLFLCSLFPFAFRYFLIRCFFFLRLSHFLFLSLIFFVFV